MADNDNSIEPYPLLSPIDVKPEPIGWLVKDLLIQGSLAVMYGAPKNLKSWLTLLFALAVATGKELGGMVPKRPGRVLIHNAEDHDPARPGGLLVSRLHALVAGFRLDRTVVHENLAILNAGHVSLGDPQQLARLRVTLAAGYDLVVLDPLVAHHDAEENSAKEMGSVMGQLLELQRVARGTLLIVHHVPKGGSSPRGSSAIMGALSTSIEVDGETGAASTVPRRVTVFHRGAPAPDSLALTGNLEMDGDMLVRATVRLGPSSAGGGAVKTKDGDRDRSKAAILIVLTEAGLLGTKTHIFDLVQRGNRSGSGVATNKTALLGMVDDLIRDGRVLAESYMYGEEQRRTNFRAAQPMHAPADDVALQSIADAARTELAKDQPLLQAVVDTVRAVGVFVNEGDILARMPSPFAQDKNGVREAIRRAHALGLLQQSYAGNVPMGYSAAAGAP